MNLFYSKILKLISIAVHFHNITICDAFHVLKQYIKFKNKNIDSLPVFLLADFHLTVLKVIQHTNLPLLSCNKLNLTYLHIQIF